MKKGLSFFSIILFGVVGGVVATNQINSFEENSIYGYKSKSQSDELSSFQESVEILENGYYDSASVIKNADDTESLVVWGNGFENTKETSGYSVIYDTFPNERITNVVLGAEMSYFVVEDTKGIETIYGWGVEIREGEIDGTIIIEPWDEPKEVFRTSNNQDIKFLGTGISHSVFVLDNNGQDELYIWGDDSYGQLGTTGLPESFDDPYLLFSTKNSSKINSIKGAAVGDYHTNVWVENSDGSESIYSWGLNNYGQVGNGYHNDIETTPSKIFTTQENEQIKMISAGFYNSVVVVENDLKEDYFYSWGRNDKGQTGSHPELGYQDLDTIDVPIISEFRTSIYEDIRLLSIGSQASSLVINNENDQDVIYIWGSNENYQFGKNLPADSSSSKLVETHTFDKDEKVTNLSFSDKSASLSLQNPNTTNSILSWGNNEYGQILNSPEEYVVEPINVYTTLSVPYLDELEKSPIVEEDKSKFDFNMSINDPSFIYLTEEDANKEILDNLSIYNGSEKLHFKLSINTFTPPVVEKVVSDENTITTSVQLTNLDIEENYKDLRIVFYGQEYNVDYDIILNPFNYGMYYTLVSLITIASIILFILFIILIYKYNNKKEETVFENVNNFNFEEQTINVEEKELTKEEIQINDMRDSLEDEEEFKF